MGAARLFRRFGGSTIAPSKRSQVATARGALDRLKAKIDAGADLSTADHRLITRLKPNALAYIGYTPRVTLS